MAADRPAQKAAPDDAVCEGHQGYFQNRMLPHCTIRKGTAPFVKAYEERCFSIS
jgi:hypothetical protein